MTLKKQIFFLFLALVSLTALGQNDTVAILRGRVIAGPDSGKTSDLPPQLSASPLQQGFEVKASSAGLKSEEPSDSLKAEESSVFPRVSLLTCSPGVEVWQQYGHTAIRYEDSKSDIDVVFNYGLFDFGAPHFIWRFCLGQTDYVVGAEPYDAFLREYTQRGSSVTQQTLALTAVETTRFRDLIALNCQPQNRTYRYNFLYKNCSTMARDILYRSLVDRSAIVSRTDSVTFRTILHRHNGNYPWASFGIDLLLGVEADRPVAHDRQEFAPAELERSFALAQVGGQTLVAEVSTIPPEAPLPASGHFPLTPVQTMILVLLLTAIIGTLELLTQTRQWWYDILLYGLQGMCGMVIAFMFLFTTHPTVDSNVLVVLFNPLAFVLLPCILQFARRGRCAWAVWTEVGLVVLLVVVWGIVRQNIPVAAWLFVASLLLRTVHHLAIRSSCTKREGRRGAFAASKPLRLSALLLILFALIPLRSLSAGTPRLVVGIIVDQLRSDYVEKFSYLYGDDGLKRLWSEGRVYSNGCYDFVSPDRSSATATVLTGTDPCYHGIVGNRYLERKTLKVKSSVDDDAVRGIHTSDKTSPTSILVTTLADELKIATGGRASVYAVAPERDMAVLAGGHAADAAVWLDNENAMWASSTSYGGVPAWVEVFNRRTNSPFDFKALKWTPYYPLSAYRDISDDAAKDFCHTFSTQSVRRYKTSAVVNDEVTQLAKTCIISSPMGRDGIPDLLCVGYYAGVYDRQAESYAPLELRDTYCRLDRSIADLVQAVEQYVGLDNALFFLTSTGYNDVHQPAVGAYNLPTGEVRMERCTALLNMYLGAIFGTGESYVEASYRNQLFLNHTLIESKQLKMRDVQERCSEFLGQMSGVSRVYASTELMEGDSNPAVRNAFNKERSGDLLLEIAPGWALTDERWSEKLWSSRAQIPVPIVFYGGFVVPARHGESVSVNTIAPTVASMLKVNTPNACAARPLF